MIGKRPIVVPGPWTRVLQIRTWRGRRWKTSVPSAPPTGCGVVLDRGRLRAPAGNHPERVGADGTPLLAVGPWGRGQGEQGAKEKNLELLGVRRGPADRRPRSHQWHRTRTLRGGLSYPSVQRSTTTCQQQRLPSPSCGSGRGTAGLGIPSPGTKHCCQNSADMAAMIGPCRPPFVFSYTTDTRPSVVAATIQSTHPPPGRTRAHSRTMHAPAGQATGSCCAGSSGRVSLQLAMRAPSDILKTSRCTEAPGNRFLGYHHPRLHSRLNFQVCAF